jgi:hypothetical protein
VIVNEPATAALELHWQELVTVALLGTDRRDPPEPGGPIADLVADRLAPTAAERMLVEVAATVAVRRAAFLPLSPQPTLARPRPDERRVCPRTVTERWSHIVSSWPVLEDEWLLLVIERGWRVDPSIVPALLARHRRDPARSNHAALAIGPLADWLGRHVPTLAAPVERRRADREQIGSLPLLPIPAELARLVSEPGDEVAATLAEALGSGTLGVTHRAVLVNLIARIPPSSLGPIAEAFGAVDPMSPSHGLAASLADLAATRHDMLDELSNA